MGVELMKLIPTLILCVLSIAYQSSTLAADGDVTTTETTQAINAEKLLCPDADFWGKKMLTDVCWSCLFPIRLLGLTIFDDSDDFAILDLFVQNNCNAGGFSQSGYDVYVGTGSDLEYRRTVILHESGSGGIC